VNCNNISQYYGFYFIFDQINADLVSIRNKTFTDPKLLNDKYIKI